MTELLARVSWLEVAFLLALSLLLDALWHSPLMFGTPWMKELEARRRPDRGPVLVALIAVAALHFALLVGLGALLGEGASTARGLLVGLVAALGCAVILGVAFWLARLTWRLYCIDAGFYLVFLALAGAALAY